MHGIEGRLVQVWRNLISNAVSFSPPGGSIRIAAARDGERVRVTVADDGPGIPTGKLTAIFDRFYSERPEGEKFGTHSGLGLSISKQIVEAHGGHIAAENRTARTAASSAPSSSSPCRRGRAMVRVHGSVHPFETRASLVAQDDVDPAIAQ